MNPLNVILIILILLLLLVVFVYVESTGFKVTRYEVKTDKMLEKNLKLVFLSDLHDTDTDSFLDRFKKDAYSSGTHTGHNKRLLNAIDVIKPDFAVLSGDMITSYGQRRYNSDLTLEFLKELAASYEVYYGLGNHEQRYCEEPLRFEGKYEFLKKYVNDLGIHFLENEGFIREDDNVGIYGLVIPIEFYRRVVTKHLPDDFALKSLGGLDESRFNIMLAHNPEHFEDYVKINPDLILAGHIHGGIIGIPGIGGLISPQLKLFPKYDFGTYKKDKSLMILGRGIGWHSIPVRIFNKAELIVIDITNAK